MTAAFVTTDLDSLPLLKEARRLGELALEATVGLPARVEALETALPVEVERATEAEETEITARIAADTALGVEIAEEVARAVARDDAIEDKADEALSRGIPNADFIGQAFTHPGDARSLFSEARVGAARDQEPITAGTIVARTNVGNVLRIAGADVDDELGYIDIARRLDWRPVLGRTYRIMYEIARAANPAGGTAPVELRWQNNNAAQAEISSAAIGPQINPVVGSGIYRRFFYIGFDPVAPEGGVTYTIPDGAVYGLPFVRVFGTGHQTDIVTIGDPIDITDEAFEDLPGLSDEIAARIAADTELQTQIDTLEETGLQNHVSAVVTAASPGVWEVTLPNGEQDNMLLSFFAPEASLGTEITLNANGVAARLFRDYMSAVPKKDFIQSGQLVLAKKIPSPENRWRVVGLQPIADIDDGYATGTSPDLLLINRLVAEYYRSPFHDLSGSADTTHWSHTLPLGQVLRDQMEGVFLAPFTSSGAAIGVITNAGTTRSLKDMSGATPAAGAIQAGTYYRWRFFGGAILQWRVWGLLSSSGGGLRRVTTTSGNGTAYTGTTSSGGGVQDDAIVAFSPNVVNEGPSTLAVDGGSAMALLRPNGDALFAGDLPALEQAVFIKGTDGLRLIALPSGGTMEYTYDESLTVGTTALDAASDDGPIDKITAHIPKEATGLVILGLGGKEPTADAPGTLTLAPGVMFNDYAVPPGPIRAKSTSGNIPLTFYIMNRSGRNPNSTARATRMLRAQDALRGSKATAAWEAVYRDVFNRLDALGMIQNCLAFYFMTADSLAAGYVNWRANPTTLLHNSLTVVSAPTLVTGAGGGQAFDGVTNLLRASGIRLNTGAALGITPTRAAAFSFTGYGGATQLGKYALSDGMLGIGPYRSASTVSAKLLPGGSNAETPTGGNLADTDVFVWRDDTNTGYAVVNGGSAQRFERAGRASFVDTDFLIGAQNTSAGAGGTPEAGTYSKFTGRIFWIGPKISQARYMQVRSICLSGIAAAGAL